MSELQRLEFAPQDGTKTTVAAWKRTVFASSENDILLPAAFFGSETEVTLCAMCDGVRMTTYKKHIYIPMDWAMRELTVPKVMIEQADNIRKNVKRTLSAACAEVDRLIANADDCEGEG